MCMYIHIYIYICTHIHTYHTYAHIYTNICMDMAASRCLHIYRYVIYTCMHIHIHVCIYMHTYVCIYIYIYIYVCMVFEELLAEPRGLRRVQLELLDLRHELHLLTSATTYQFRVSIINRTILA